MYLKEVILNGFKSFAVRTRIQLKPGVTTIVGPNGCGKSNVVDGIRWVLGEQSAKALRGGKMQDVIFGGTDKRAPLNLCEVSLIFTDCEDKLGTAFNEVEIMRRVTRDGGSEYLLNGKKSRLKDIQNLFMDTGIGRVSYSFMMQGQIDQILSSNPMERRGIFEEAAGITRYKSQRKEAMGKLALVDQNLTRAIDVMDEVGRQKDSVEKQATKALKFHRLNHRVSHLELAHYSYHFLDKTAIVSELQKKIADMGSEVLDSQASLVEEEALLTENKAKRTELYDSLQAMQQSIFDLRSEKDQAQNQIKIADARKDDVRDRMDSMHDEIAQLQEKKQAIQERLDGDVRFKEEQADIVGSSDDVFKAQQEELQVVEQRVREAESNLFKKKQEGAKLDAEKESIRVKLSNAELELKGFQVKQASLQESLLALEEEQSQFQARHTEACREQEHTQEQLQLLKSDLQQGQSILNQSRGDFKDLQRLIQDQDRVVSRLSAHLNALESLQENFEGFSDGAKAILNGELGDSVDLGAIHLIMKQISIEPELAPMLELLMGPAVDAILFQDQALFTETLSALKDQDLGRASFYIKHPAKPLLWPKVSKLPEGITSVSECINFSDTKIQDHIEPLFSGCYFAQDIETWMSFLNENPDFQFFLVATKSGEVMDARGLIFGGSSSEGSSEQSYLQRVNEIKRLDQEQKKEAQSLELLNKRAQDLQQKMDALEDSIEQQREELMVSEQSLSEYNAEVKTTQSRLSEIQINVEKGQDELDLLQDSFDDAQELLATARTALEQKTQAIKSLKIEQEEEEKIILESRNECDAKKEEFAQVRVDLAEKKQKLEMLEQGLSQLKNEQTSAQERILYLEDEICSFEGQVVTLTEDAENLKARIGQLDNYLAERNKILSEFKEELVTLEASITELDESLTVRRNAKHEQEKALTQIEIRISEERSKMDYLRDKAESQHDVAIEEVDWKLELWKADAPFQTKIDLGELLEDEEPEAKDRAEEPTEDDLAALDATDWKSVKSEMKQIKGKISALGAVNLVAIEEYGELKERFNFLKSQTDDLIHSKEELVNAIDKINEISQELFRETFVKVRDNFKYTFEGLFGGGNADLKLMDEDDILDTGIEIVAQPPGTRLKGLTLLSGGQKTMTAVALLFAIYMVKPSPFCVLDELDAPLDDSNIGRFTDLLRKFTEYSQFLVISHSKRTIAASDTIYGVTMKERGVTSMISMRFDHKSGRTESIPKARSDQKVEVTSAKVIQKQETPVSV